MSVTVSNPAGARTVLLASPRSFCAGVERAIAVVEQLLDQRGGPVYVRKQIVHNMYVVADLQARGAVFVDELDAVPDGAMVVFSAHGVSPAVRAEAAGRGLEVIDATCPLVTKVHAEARRFAARGDTVVLIGHAGHEEVEGTLGEAPGRTVLVQTAGEVAGLEVADPARVSYLMQTTLAVDEAAEVVGALRARFPALRGPASDDICYATTNRQEALRAIAQESDLVLVVGSANSSNSVRLVELAQRHGTPSYLIDDPGDIRPEWLDGVAVVGLTAGASAPPRLVDSVIAALGPVTVVERETTRETIAFTLACRGAAVVSLLGRITGPTDLKGLSTATLVVLAQEIRAFLIEKVSGVGGHLGPNLGVVEVTIAAHRVFDSPRDVLLFDTGHQAYVHKILTGRGAEFDSLRQAGGLSGYPSRTESVHDVIENSHASTALSYADGLAKAFALRGATDRRVVAIVGDGAMTGGMCWEALNNIGAAPDRPVIIVLNDNGRSYSPTVGGFARHLAELRQSTMRQSTMGQSTMGQRATGQSLFENLGLVYLGPVDGHDITDVETALHQAASLRRPVVVHCVTRKGNGYPPAERDEADCLHTVGVIDPTTGCSRSINKPTWTSVFAEEIVAIGADRDDVVCLTAAMPHPTGLGGFAARFPDRVFDVGIAEQHAVTCAAGLALGGCHPVVAIYSTFLSRAFDQLLTDVALHQLPVTIVADRAGITGPDGPSHHGMWDASLLPVVPGLRLAAPRDCAQLRALLREALDITDGPTVIRYPKATTGPDIPATSRIGHCDILRDDPAAVGLLVAVGPLAGPCLAAADELTAHDIPVTVIDPRWTAPLDPALLTLAGAYRLVLTVEDTTATAALGARIAQALAATGADTCAATYALPPRFLAHASREEILRAHGLDAAGIATAVLKRLTSTHQGKITPKEI